MRIAPEVAEAVAAGRPVVALESTLISHGLPRPRNLDVAHEVEAAVRQLGWRVYSTTQPADQLPLAQAVLAYLHG